MPEERLRTPPCCIRLYTPSSDVPPYIVDDVAFLYERVFKGTPRETTIDNAKREIETHLSTSDAALFTYEIAGGVVAFTLGICDSNSVYVPVFAIDESFRGGPTAARLMVALGKWAVEKHCTNYLFWAEAGSQATKITTSRGGEIIDSEEQDQIVFVRGKIDDLIGHLIDGHNSLTPLSKGNLHSHETPP